MTRGTGILGGTFDPVHLGHLAAAKATHGLLGLERTLLIPSAIPPHRRVQPAASGFHRFAMAALAIADDPRFAVSDVELLAGGPSYTWTTLRALNAAGHDPVSLFFITGEDAFSEIATWHRYPEILELSRFVVVSRPGGEDEARRAVPSLGQFMVDVRSPSDVRAIGDRMPAVLLVNVDTPDISSTDIRRRLEQGRPVEGLLPPLVHDHIRRHNLYGTPAAQDAGEGTARRPASTQS